MQEVASNLKSCCVLSPKHRNSILNAETFQVLFCNQNNQKDNLFLVAAKQSTQIPIEESKKKKEHCEITGDNIYDHKIIMCFH